MARLCGLGLKLPRIGPESGDDITLKNIAKGASSTDHVGAAAKSRSAGMKQSLIFLRGPGAPSAAWNMPLLLPDSLPSCFNGAPPVITHRAARWDSC